MVASDIADKELTTKASKFPITLHISEGNKLFRLAQYEKALNCFDAGLKVQPNNIRCLLGRAKCLLKLLKYDEAKQAAENILNLEPKCPEAYTLLGNTEFTKGNFENSYIAFYSGYLKRPYSLDLRLGHQMCKRAIDNSVNPDNPQILNNTDVTDVKNILQNKYKRRSDKNKRTSSRNQMHSKDFKFIKSLLKDKNCGSVSSICQDLFGYLKERQVFWRMHNPCLKKTCVNTAYEPLKDQKLLNYLLNMCSEAAKSFSKGDAEACKKICCKIIGIIDKPFHSSTREYMKIKADAFHFLGLAYMLGDDMPSALECHWQQLKIAKSLNESNLKKRSFYDIGEDFMKYGDFEQALSLFRQCVDFVASRDEEAIVMYKIADCELCLDNLEEAFKNGREALSIARSCNDRRLQCDSTMLLAEIAIRNKNMKEARDLYTDALDIAEESQDSRLSEIKDLIKMFYEKLHDFSREESILSFASRLEASRSSLRRLMDFGSVLSDDKYHSDDSSGFLPLNTEVQSGNECLSVESNFSSANEKSKTANKRNTKTSSKNHKYER